jgi:hypothetical protein
VTNELARYALTIPSSGQLTKRYIWVDRRHELIVLLQVTVTHTPSPFQAESMDKVEVSYEQSEPVLYPDADSANAAACEISDQLIREGWQPYLGDPPSK